MQASQPVQQVGLVAQQALKGMQEVSPASFYVAWAISGVLLLVIAILVGRATGKGVLGILVDNRDRFSLNRLQLVMWTLLVLSTLLGMFFSAVVSHLMYGSKFLPENIDLAFAVPNNLLILMGISVGSATTAGAVKSSKDLNPNALVPIQGTVEPNPAAKAEAVVNRAPTSAAVKKPRKLSQVVLEEEGSQIDKIVDVAKFQNFIFTIALGLAYIVLAANLPKPNYPVFSDTVLWLLGVSHAGYVAGKLPTKA